MRRQQHKNISIFKRHKKSFSVAVVVLIMVGVLAVLELTNRTYFFHDRKAVSGQIHSAPPKAESSPPSDKDSEGLMPDSNAPMAENPKEGDATSAPAPSGAPPLAPYGNFISNHSPNLDGNPASSAVESVCNTTPGATCRIEFTNKDGVVKSLEARTANSSGAVYWSWDINQAGFTVGTWKIKVITELNNQSKVADGAPDLEVKP